MIELESTRARRHPISDSQESKILSGTMKNFNPRLTTGWKLSDPTLVARMYQSTKEEAEKWLHVRAALLNFELNSSHKIVLQASQSEEAILSENNINSLKISGRANQI